MIFKIKKNFFLTQTELAIVNQLGQTELMISKLKRGYYIYNREGVQVGQITFENNMARVSLAKLKTDKPDGIAIFRAEGNKFLIETPKFTKEDTKCLDKLSSKLITDNYYSLIGKCQDFNYDIFKGNIAVANIVPSATDIDLYSVRINEGGNLIKLVMIVLAIDKLLADPSSKL